MSRETVVASRYAKALLELTRERNVVWEAEETLRAFVHTLETEEQVRKFFDAPNISVSVKTEVFRKAINSDQLSILAQAVQLLLERGRFGALKSVLDAYVVYAGEAFGEVRATVFSPKPITEDEQQKLADKFGALLGKTVRINNSVNPELLGGLTVRIGDTLYDGSLRGKLDRLDKSLQSV